MIAVVLAGLVTLTLFYFKDASFASSRAGRVWVLGGTFVLASVGACLFLVATHRFVRAVNIYPLGKSVTVTVGYERTELAKEIAKRTSQGSDWELLQERGASEEHIRDLWTDNSILMARLALFSSFMLFLIAATATACLAVVFDALGTPTSP